MGLVQELVPVQALAKVREPDQGSAVASMCPIAGQCCLHKQRARLMNMRQGSHMRGFAT